ncbi:hypothetical protein Pmani_029240 [Petrolisthes manimaculis]|uniref:Uncharacterized protein n=1 Tax=Petrolisthes manimaculis TaxID=1843537 RepID=A0AAE1NZS1_9EUCA|nr:hypothetical protein Pmani_029240 [Petrolisthes manimaculis]
MGGERRCEVKRWVEVNVVGVGGEEMGDECYVLWRGGVVMRWSGGEREMSGDTKELVRSGGERRWSGGEREMSGYTKELG